ncbi:unnamed protein product, partial [Rotaria sp. Silwood2]
MRAGATGEPIAKRTVCVQRRITTLADHYANDEINLGEYLEAHVVHLLELTPVYRGSREYRRYTAGIPAVGLNTA